MEEILRNRLELRRAKLKKLADTEVAETLTKSQTEGVSLEDLKNAKILLTEYLVRFQSELNSYIERITEPATDLMEQCLRDQIEVEDKLDAITIMLQSTPAQALSTPLQTGMTKLPKLELQKYNGDVLRFTEFWDSFEANVHSKAIKDVEKLSYLLASLEGKAKEAVVGLTTTNSNYSIAINILRKQFGSSERVTDAHYEALNNLTRSGNSSTECRRTLNSIEKHLRVLESLNEKTEGSHLRVLLLSKFPETVLYQVNLLTQENRNTDAIQEALNKVITAMESADVSQEHIVGPAVSPTSALHVNVEQRRKRHLARDFQSSKKRRTQCAFCDSGEHYSDQCKTYKTFQERKTKLGTKCWTCFRPGHNSRQCTSKLLCVHCKKRNHNRALCFRTTSSSSTSAATGRFRPKFQPEHKTKEKVDKQIDQNLAANGNMTEPMDEVHTMVQNLSNQTFLQTAVAKINNETCRLLLDSGSQRSYISTRMAKKLSLMPDKEDFLMVFTFGADKPKEITSPSVEVEITTKRGMRKMIRVNIVPNITKRIPMAKVDTTGMVDLLADCSSVGEGIDLLIGNDYYFTFMKQEHIKLRNYVYLINSEFGWLVSGNATEGGSDHTLSIVTYCQCHQSGCPYFTEPDLPLRNIDLKFLWTLESIGITDSPKASREEEAVKFFNDTTLYKQGRYEVKWPWIQYPPELPTNFGIAYGRLKGLLKRSDDETIKEYNDILNGQLEANIIEVVESNTSPYEQTEPPVTYLPHHLVKQGNKGRIVYDGSAKTKDTKSLNECLYSGPSMLEDLTGLILKFRTGKIGITADVEKAFLQVALQEPDRDVTRFLWIKDLTKDATEDNLIHLRFCRVPFGIISSPFLLTATIRHHMARTNKALISQVADKCYVDNLLLSVKSEAEALELYTETRQVFNEISMNIRDWTSNSDEFLKRIPESQSAKQKDKVKVLGLMWHLEKDNLKLNAEKMTDIETGMDEITKKDVLRTLARLYDPCGFVSPAILPAKLIFQDLCTRKVKWDQNLPEDMKESWLHTLVVLKSTEDVVVPRYVANSMPEEEEIQYELHCFCDASKDAYAAVIYLRMICRSTTKTAFLMSKSRITPIEDKENLKIPRLELLAYLIGSRLTKYVKSNLNLDITRQVLWSDSLVVLAWMKSNKLLPPFVQRRVDEIKQNKELELRYVNTKVNPADVATRPENWQSNKDLWFHGPEFLLQTEEYWPSCKQSSDDITLLVGEALDGSDDVELTMREVESVETCEEEPMDEDNPVVEFTLPLGDTNPETESVRNIKRLQSESFPEESLGKETHLSRNLGLFRDVEGLIRCKGRMSNTNWPYDKKYPILIPKDSAFTTEIIQKAHNDNFHIGTAHTLSMVRHKYWIPQGRAQVKKVIKSCPKCIKYGGGPYKLPPPPALPSERVNYSTPFTYVGVDYLGPMYVVSKLGNEKRWICLFTCLAIRAVHLEVVNDLTAEECLLALRRCIASRGLIKKIISDNALYFRLTSEVLSSPYCKENSIEWRFITQLAPWKGGFYERLVALVKNSLKRTLDKHSLNDHQLMTIVKEIETVINSRPLTCVGTELEHVLKPSDFLSLGICLTPAPSQLVTGTETTTKVDLLKSWTRGHAVLNEFKHMFVNQYLSNLRERYTHSNRQPRVKVQREPRVGDIVQIKEDSKNRGNWKVGKISSLIQSADGQCRSAKVKVGHSEYIRSVGHLYPLETDTYDNDGVASSPPEGVLRETPILEDPPTISEKPSEQPTTPSSRKRVFLEEDIVSDKHGEDTDMASLGDSHAPSSVVGGVDQSQEDVTNEVTDEVINEVTDEVTETDEVDDPIEETRPRRDAAIRAREKIAEWTRQLAALL